MKSFLTLIILGLTIHAQASSPELHHFEIRKELNKNKAVLGAIAHAESIIRTAKCSALEVTGTWRSEGYKFEAISTCLEKDGTFIGISIEGQVYDPKTNYPVISKIEFNFAG